MMRKLLIAAIITAIIIILLPEVAGNNFKAMQSIISNTQFSLVLLLLIFIGKLLATVIAFGFGVLGGIFGPTIFLGAALGALVSGFIALFVPEVFGYNKLLLPQWRQ